MVSVEYVLTFRRETVLLFVGSVLITITNSFLFWIILNTGVLSRTRILRLDSNGRPYGQFGFVLVFGFVVINVL